MKRQRNGPLRVVIADDSAICRAAIREILQRDGDIEVVGEAEDGQTAIELIEQLKPDLATIDIKMPGLPGLDAIEAIMARCPVPLLVVTAQAKDAGDQLAFEAIVRGALDLTPKPIAFRPDQATSLRARVRQLAGAPVVKRGVRRDAMPKDARPAPATPPARANKPLRVLVVDDSPVCRAALRKLLEQEGDILVVGEAANGEEAAKMAERLGPDVTTMDLNMPDVSGYEGIERIMARAPVPILVVTSTEAEEGEARRLGALELVSRPMSFRAEEGQALRDRVRRLARVPVIRHLKKVPPPHAPAERKIWPQPGHDYAAVAVAASAGGPAAVAQLLATLTPGFSLPVMVVQHMAPAFTASFASYLETSSRRVVKMVDREMRAEPGTVFVAAPDQHLIMPRPGFVAPDHGEPVDGFRPSATVLFQSVAWAYGASAIGVVLTGLGRDGAAGLAAMRKQGALTIAQASAAVDGMPRAARELGAAQENLQLDDISALLNSVASRPEKREG